MASQQHKRARDGAAPSPLASSAHQPVSKKRRSRASVKKQRRKSASSSRNQPAAGAGGGCDRTSGSGSAASMAERGSTLPFGVAGHGSARDIGARVFAHLIAPMSVETFLNTYWEKKPLLVRRSDPSYYKGIMSSARVHKLLKQRKLTYEKDVDVTRYKDGAREFRNRSGIADASRVWKMFTEQGFSVRLLCPHAHVEPLWRLLAALEDFFGCFCGCNTYLTPRATQGFPPHCDDIEAFLMQVEGEKRWRVYAPLDDEGYLPRAAKAFTGMELGEPVVDAVLRPGDLLYFPRGWIHQGVCTDSSEPSFHITLSTALHQNWSDLLRLLLPQALDIATQQTEMLRASVPRDLTTRLGVLFAEAGPADDSSDDGSQASVSKHADRREALAAHAQELCMSALASLPIDAAVDQMARRFIHDRLPPVLTSSERAAVAATPALVKHAFPAGHSASASGPPTLPKLFVCALRPALTRLAIEDGSCAVYSAMRNARVHHDKDEQRLVFPIQAAVALETLFALRPDATTGAAVQVADMPWGFDDDAMDATNAERIDGVRDLVTKLAKAGIVVASRRHPR